jgi:predicted aspartyl protease
MGTFSVTIEISDTAGFRFESVQDTGATYPVLPRGLLVDLGYQPLEKRPFSLADGRVLEYDVGVVSLRLDGRTLPVVCVFGDDNIEPSLGAVALENFLLAPDPVNRILVPLTGRLM